jgi:hypothetical protein
MRYSSILSIDVPGVESSERTALYDALEDNGFSKFDKLDTVWTAEIEADNEDLAYEHMLSNLKNAVIKGNVPIVAILQVGNTQSGVMYINTNGDINSDDSSKKSGDLWEGFLFGKDKLPHH